MYGITIKQKQIDEIIVPHIIFFSFLVSFSY